MTHVALNDRFPRDDRVHGLSDRAFRLHVAALCMCSGDLTDGLISTSPRLALLRVLTKATQKHVQELVKVGLFRPVIAGETFIIDGFEGSVEVLVKADGYYLDGYLELNRSRGRVEAVIESRKEAGRLGGLAKARASATANALAGAQASPEPHLTSPTPTGESEKASSLSPDRALSDRARGEISDNNGGHAGLVRETAAS